MKVILDFLWDFLKQFVGGFFNIFKGIFTGIVQMLNMPEYFNIFSEYKGEFAFWQWMIILCFVFCRTAKIR